MYTYTDMNRRLLSHCIYLLSNSVSLYISLSLSLLPTTFYIYIYIYIAVSISEYTYLSCDHGCCFACKSLVPNASRQRLFQQQGEQHRKSMHTRVPQVMCIRNKPHE